jgi:hypothetical protein
VQQVLLLPPLPPSPLQSPVLWRGLVRAWCVRPVVLAPATSATSLRCGTTKRSHALKTGSPRRRHWQGRQRKMCLPLSTGCAASVRMRQTGATAGPFNFPSARFLGAAELLCFVLFCLSCCSGEKVRQRWCGWWRRERGKECACVSRFAGARGVASASLSLRVCRFLPRRTPLAATSQDRRNRGGTREPRRRRRGRPGGGEH